MTDPYEREITSQTMPVSSGVIDLRCGDMGVTATVFSGEVQISLIEDVDAVVTAFDVTEPVRFLNSQRRLRLVVEAAFNQMRIAVDQPPPGNG